METLNTKRWLWISGGLLAVYWVVSFLSLGRIPIAWLDETMFTDPSFQLAKTGHLSSNQWGQPGTEFQFLAYLPMGFWYLGSWFYVFGVSLLAGRMPFFITGFVLFILLFYYLKQNHRTPLVFILLCFLFFEKSIMECLRNGRFEALELLIFGLIWVVGVQKERRFFVAFLSGCMALIHPVCWPIAGVLVLWSLYNQSPLSKLGLILLALLPSLSWMLSAQIQWADFSAQFLSHGSDHSAIEADGSIFLNHFIYRFFPFSETQIVLPIIHLLMWIWIGFKGIKNGIKSISLIQWIFISTSSFYLIAAGPFPRYNPLLVLIMFLVLVEIKSIPKINFIKKLVPVVLILHLIPFLLRFALLIIQWEARSPELALDNLSENLKEVKQNTLLVEGSLGYYYSLNHPEVKYSNRYSLDKKPFNSFKEVIWLSPELQTDTSLFEPILTKQLEDPGVNIIAQLHLPKTYAYADLHLYKIKSEKGYDLIKRKY